MSIKNVREKTINDSEITTIAIVPSLYFIEHSGEKRAYEDN
ncbi:MAG TPA: hypothetical protein VFI29_12800 [Hanamia sp.]|nr:hypothetical protein [Hanamia sp.]